MRMVTEEANGLVNIYDAERYGNYKAMFTVAINVLPSEVDEKWNEYVQHYNEEKLRRQIDAITSPKFSHTRAKRMFGQWVVLIYHREKTSPTGVLHAYSGTEDEIVPLLEKYGKPSPLAPFN